MSNDYLLDMYNVQVTIPLGVGLCSSLPLEAIKCLTVWKVHCNARVKYISTNPSDAPAHYKIISR